MKKRILLGLLLPMGFAHSAIEHTAFTDINDEAKTIDLILGQVENIRNKTDLEIAVSAGLDRRIRVVTKTENGHVTSDTTSSVISIGDRINIGGKAFYGKQFTIPAQSNGNHTITVSTLNLSGDIVNVEEYQVLRDTQAPTSGEKYISSYGGTSNSFTPADVWHTGYWHQNFIELRNIEDNLSGINTVEIISHLMEEGGVEYKRRELGYNALEKISRFHFNTDSGFWPTGDNADTLFGVSFSVTDNAGNVHNTSIQPMYYDTVNARGLELIGVRNPNSTNEMGGEVGWDPYVPGMHVYENPISIMYRVPKNEHRTYHRGGYTAVGAARQIHDHDDDYVYIVYTRTYGFTDTNFIRFQDQRQWSAGSISYNLVLAPGVAESPKRVGGAQYRYSDIGWASWRRWHVQTSELPIEILGSRQFVEPRPYQQKWTHAGHSCIIEVGADHCETTHTTGTWKLEQGGSRYFHEGSSITSVDGTLTGPPAWADVSYNAQYPPVITSHRVEGNVLIGNVYQEMAGSWFDNLKLRDFWLEDPQGNKVNATRTLVRNGVYYEAEWDLTSLPEGRYSVSMVAEEMHGLTDRIDNAHSFVNDLTPPEVTFGYKGNDNIPDVITELRDIEIKLDDELSEVFIEQITIESHDGTIDVVIGYSQVGGQGTSKVFAPELPRLFPSLDRDKEYTMTVTARDAFFNRHTDTLHFGFIPANLVTMRTQQSLPSSKLLMDSHNRGITQIYSDNNLVLEDGRNATGPQDAIVTLNSDSAYSVMVNGVTIKPGDSEDVTIDLGPTGGRLNLPVMLQADGVEGTADIMFEIPRLTSIYD